MSDAGRVGSIERVDGGQSRMGSLAAGWRRVSRKPASNSRRGVGSMILAWVGVCQVHSLNDGDAQ